MPAQKPIREASSSDSRTFEKVISVAASRQPDITESAEGWFGSATAIPLFNIIAVIRAMTPNRTRLIGISPAAEDYARRKSFFAEIFWPKGDGTKKRSRQPRPSFSGVLLCEVRELSQPGRLLPVVCSKFCCDSEIETGPPRKGANTSVAVDGLTQRLDIIRVVEKTPDLSTVAPGQQLGIAFAICGFALCGICGDGLAPPNLLFPLCLNVKKPPRSYTGL